MSNLFWISICFIPLIFLIITRLKTLIPTFSSTALFSILKNNDGFVQWTSAIVTAAPSLTVTIHRNFFRRLIITANPAVVHHILNSHFHNYQKGDFFRSNLMDLLGDGIFNADGHNWKFQRQLASHDFTTTSLRKYLDTAVDSEISGRLIPILEHAAAAEETAVLDLQDILQRFAFDNICKIAFGHDPEYLSPSLRIEEFVLAFDIAVKISSERFVGFIPYTRQIKKALGVGSEKKLKAAVIKIREFATNLVREKKIGENNKSSDADLLSAFLQSTHSDEEFVTDVVISFILAGKDTMPVALSWFFWLLSGHRRVEEEILKEITGLKRSAGSASGYNEVKEMVYTHAALCESMRLYPPVPVNTKEAVNDDVLPDGTPVKKGMRVSYHPYAMGRVEKVWGIDWAEFRPERWLKRDAAVAGKWSFVNRDPYTYPVFQAGPRICLGKELAFVQMKRVVAAILRRFVVVPVIETEPTFEVAVTAKMKGGFPVRIQARPPL